MAESEPEATAATAGVPPPSSSSTSTSSFTLVKQQQRRVIADVISSPVLPRYPSTLRTHAAREGEDNETQSTQSSRKESARRRQNHQQRHITRRSLRVRKMGGDDKDDVPVCLTTRMTMLTTSSSDKGTDSSCISERDSLLERLREKEKQFDAKITTLDETLLCAEKGRLQRDHIIDSLRGEVERLRAQLELTAVAKSQTDELREKLLTERTAALEEARAKIVELSDTLHVKGQRVRELEKELKLRKASVTASSEIRSAATTALELSRPSQQQRHQQQQQQEQEQKPLMVFSVNDNSLAERGRERQKRERYTDNLRKLRDEVYALEQSYKITRKEKEALAEENYALRCKLEAIQESMETRAAKAMKAMQDSMGQKREIEAEVVATRLSMARLLRLLSEVPEMRRYLRVNEVDGNIIFAGYTNSAVALGTNTESNDVMQRRRSGGVLTVIPGTGVDDGIYGGNLLLQSCNVYLNGQWCRQLQEIIDDENYFLRRAKIHIGDLEDAARCGKVVGIPRVPAPSDVLQGRQHEKDFWIPYSIFVEAQKFKNSYFPSLSYECFYPFLIAINRVWNDKLKRRVASVTQRRLHEQQQRQQKRWGRKKEQMIDILSFGERPHDSSPSALVLWQQLQELRREVRRRVTGKNSLELFNLYDNLTKCALQHLRNVQMVQDRLLEQHSHNHRFEVTQTETDVEDEEEDGEKMWLEEDEKRNEVDNVESENIVLLRTALSTLAREVQEVSECAASRIGASCCDMQKFLVALRDRQFRMGSQQETWQQQQQQQQLGDEYHSDFLHAKGDEGVPTCTLLRIIDGVLGFVDEVQQEVLTAQSAVSRCAARADERSELLLPSREVNADIEKNAAVDTEGDSDGREHHRPWRRHREHYSLSSNLLK